MLALSAFLFTLVIPHEARGFLYGLTTPFLYVSALTAGSFLAALAYGALATVLGITSYIICGEKK